MTGLESGIFLSRRKHRTKPVPPRANRFMTNINTAFVEQIFDLPQR
jgi:hypothetical protein